MPRKYIVDVPDQFTDEFIHQMIYQHGFMPVDSGYSLEGKNTSYQGWKHGWDDQKLKVIKTVWNSTPTDDGSECKRPCEITIIKE